MTLGVLELVGNVVVVTLSVCLLEKKFVVFGTGF